MKQRDNTKFSSSSLGSLNSLIRSRFKAKAIKKAWWTPVWTGLVSDSDSKHRIAMGSAIWLYLYLLAYTNRTTGIFRRKQALIRSDTGIPLRTIQRYFWRLVAKGYIRYLDKSHPPQIRIERLRLFNSPTTSHE